MELKYVVAAMKSSGGKDVDFFIEIEDEKTLQFMEKRYPGKLTFDGCRTFTLKTTIPMRDMDVNSPEMWEKLKVEHPEIISAFVYGRLRGDI